MLESFVGYQIGKSSLSIKLAIKQMFISKGFDITPEQWGVLYTLSKEDGQYQNKLANKLLKQKPNITRLIDILEEKKLLIRKINTEDRRVYKVYLTEKGRKLAEAIYSHIVNFENKLCQELQKEEIVTLGKLLGKLTINS
ncbi:MAG: hypothetical protein A2287_04485 [Candidatus Melainabacteria bacterium RIFOXYA12_FULL_32_12]|nr:MAG: hypothetical protein A2255_03750 [Candidatus Melainabacteria bacterium RIFOXYA2_FULL_32_9]OGI31731.1 MAG: hypothetical protein A2287_04485 [Candidatus Melainabacteria bacterium RIFOXYA12_FULL_32_12]